MKHVKPLATTPVMAQEAPAEVSKLVELALFAMFQPSLCALDLKGKMEDMDTSFSKCSAG